MEGSITRDSHEGGVRRRYINSFLSISASISSNEQDEASIYIYIYIKPFLETPMGKAFISPRRIIEKNRSWLTDRLRSSMVERNKTWTENRGFSSEKIFLLSFFSFLLLFLILKTRSFSLKREENESALISMFTTRVAFSFLLFFLFFFF